MALIQQSLLFEIYLEKSVDIEKIFEHCSLFARLTHTHAVSVSVSVSLSHHNPIVWVGRKEFHQESLMPNLNT
jgi:hypothetical protein